MALSKVQNVPLVSQYDTGVCWMASAMMVYKWQEATGNGSMIDPMSHADSAGRYGRNGDWFCGNNGMLAGYFKMKKHSSLSMTYEAVSSFLAKHGPIWTGLQKNWTGKNHGHVVVICGVADTGVFIHDPEPVKQGSSMWLTWGQINKALSAISDVADYQFLTAA
jgi:hypothetical protein